MKTLFSLLTVIGIFMIISIPNHADLYNWDILQIAAVILIVAALAALFGLIAYILPEKKKVPKRRQSLTVHKQKISAK